MTAETSPLLNVFFRLQSHGFPLGVQEYLNALDALAQGFGVGSRRELIFTCQVLWAKSPEEQRQVAEALAADLPEELLPGDLSALLDSMKADVTPKPDQPDNTSPNSEPDRSVAKPEGKPDREPTTTPAVLPRFELSGEATDVSLPVPVPERWAASPNFDFAGQLPVTRRQMKGSWRYYRRMQRVGQPVEVDVPATVERMYRQGTVVEPVIIPRRLNLARMLVLADEGGSMVPFRRITGELLESACQSGLARVAIYFFHDCPTSRLFRDASLIRSDPLDSVLQEFADAGVLIVSDGGAARGHRDEARAGQTAEFLRALRRHTANIAWLNPVPEARWAGTTAEQICRRAQVPMMTFDRAGLDAAVDVLRGRGR